MPNSLSMPDIHSIGRSAGDFQQPVSREQMIAICRRAFGASVDVESAVELGGGQYNSTYRVDLRGEGPVIVLIAPEPYRQFRLERGLMRNEHASVPYLAPIADFMPRTLAVDFTHDLINRDYLIQTHLVGVPAPEGLAAYPREKHGSFWEDLGRILARVHSVTGPGFGRTQGPHFGTWSAAIESTLDDIAADLEETGLVADDVRQVGALVAAQRWSLDEISQPVLLHGDLWIGNVMLAADTTEPRISGVFDCDRTSWGDPMADWTMFLIARRAQDETAAFWHGYGRRPEITEGARIRSHAYRARSIGESRLEYHRLHDSSSIAQTYVEMAQVLTELTDP
ncbi:phosphotransferase family protein [Pseudarthrobacter sp. P1]|uniref:phosphotransferase family protein n=1 Tax=Pseudarthrobacter sp. P1 TaxID=3418418 RepID=UPI003CF18E0E